MRRKSAAVKVAYPAVLSALALVLVYGVQPLAEDGIADIGILDLEELTQALPDRRIV